MEPMLTAKETARLLKTTARRVNEMCEAKQLAGKKIGVQWRVYPESIRLPNMPVTEPSVNTEETATQQSRPHAE